MKISGYTVIIIKEINVNKQIITLIILAYPRDGSFSQHYFIYCFFVIWTLAVKFSQNPHLTKKALQNRSFEHHE